MPSLLGHLPHEVHVTLTWQRVPTLIGRTWAVGWKITVWGTQETSGTAWDLADAVEAVNRGLTEHFRTVEAQENQGYDSKDVTGLAGLCPRPR